MIIYFDTETSGLCPGQIGQLSYIIHEDRSITSKNMFMEVDYVDPGATRVTGLTVEKLKRLSGGKRFCDYADEIFEDFSTANLIIAHNIKFDLAFMIEEFYRLNRTFRYNDCLCSMKYFTPLLKIARSSKNGYKYPSLKELREKMGVLDLDMEWGMLDMYNNLAGAHDARYDTLALYLSLKNGSKIYPELKEIIAKNIL